jgi:hypothetical protein
MESVWLTSKTHGGAPPLSPAAVMAWIYLVIEFNTICAWAVLAIMEVKVRIANQRGRKSAAIIFLMPEDGQFASHVNQHRLKHTSELSLGFVDPRIGMKECELCDSSEWRPGATCQATQSGEPTIGLDPEAEAAVKAITDQILAQMK